MLPPQKIYNLIDIENCSLFYSTVGKFIEQSVIFLIFLIYENSNIKILSVLLFDLKLNFLHIYKIEIQK